MIDRDTSSRTRFRSRLVIAPPVDVRVGPPRWPPRPPQRSGPATERPLSRRPHHPPGRPLRSRDDHDGPAAGPATAHARQESPMPRYGAQYGPDITYLGVDRCDLDDPASFADA